MVDGVPAGADRRGLHACRPQTLGDEGSDAGFVLDDQYLRHVTAFLAEDLSSGFGW